MGLFSKEVSDKAISLFSFKVNYKNEPNNILALPIPMHRATNSVEVADYKVRKTEAEAAGLPFTEDPVYLKINFEVSHSFFSTLQQSRTELYLLLPN